MIRGAWQATVHGVAKSRTRLSDFHFRFFKTDVLVEAQQTWILVLICLQCGTPGFDPWVGKIPWRRKWQPTPVFSPGKCHGQRSLLGRTPWVL